MALKTTLSAIDADSYVTLAEANEYLAGNSVFLALEDAAKENLLRQATMQIDTMRFFGVKCSVDQALKFPRIMADENAIEVGQTAIPVKVKMATCEQVAHILDGSGAKRMQLQNDGVKSVSIGDVSESFAGKADALSFSMVAKGYLKGYISKIGRITNY